MCGVDSESIPALNQKLGPCAAAAGLGNLAVTLAATAALAAWTDALAWVHANFLPLLTAAVGFSFLLSAVCYAASFRRVALLASHGSSGYFLYDFFMGRELNPRIGKLDLKEVIELYPGLIGTFCFAFRHLSSWLLRVPFVAANARL